MNTQELNDQVLEDLAGMHRTRFVGSLLSRRLADAPLEELILYGYGVVAGSEEAEKQRQSWEVRTHEGHLDCEISPHFWRGVCEARRAEIGMPFNQRPRKKTDDEGRPYARFKIRGSPQLLWRLYDFFERYSDFPDVACKHFEDQIECEKGFVQLNGLRAYKAVSALYRGASVGGLIEKANKVMESQSPDWWETKPRRADLSSLRPIPDDIFDERRAPLARISQRMGASAVGQRGSSGA